MKDMKGFRLFGGIIFGLLYIGGPANAEFIPFDSERWVFNGSTKIVEHDGKSAITLGYKEKKGGPPKNGEAVLKDFAFKNGIIEYDVSFGEVRAFVGTKFRIQPGQQTFENFYMRAHQSGNPDANQYMPNINGVASWQLYYGKQYSAPTKYTFDTWTHVKIVVAGNLADFFIGDMKTPAFTSELKLNQEAGQVGVWGFNIGGPVHIANFNVTSEDQPAISGEAVPEVPAAEGSILSWDISSSFDGKVLDSQTSLDKVTLDEMTFRQLSADKTGKTNLAVVQGVEKGKDTVFAKFIVTSASEQIKKMDFGFSDKAKVYLNQNVLYEGADEFRSRDYRFLGTMGYYDSVYLPLKKGENEVIIAVTEGLNKTGWGVQAKFSDLKGLKIQTPNN